jgi:glycosyltransferase involved in cell wall biosynthesis
MKLWMICWRYPVLSEVIVVTEFAEMLRQGADGVLIPLHQLDGPGITANIPPERLMRPIDWPVSRLAQFRLLLELVRHKPGRFIQCLLRVRDYVGDDARGALISLAVITAAARNCEEPQHIHAHFGGHLAHVAALLAVYFHCPWSTTVHANDIYKQPRRLPADFRDAAFVRTISEHGRDWVLSHCPNLKPQKVALIHCGVDIQQLRVVETKRRDNSPLRLLAVGRLVPKKGHDLLIEACVLLRERGYAVECDIIGDGPQRTLLETLIAEKKLKESVRLLGSQPRTVVLEHLAACDVMALACREASDGDRDGIPLVLMEAMAMGKPVIAGDAGGVRELVTQGGYLLRSITPSQLAVSLENVLNLPAEKRQEIGLQGRQRVEDAFALTENVRKVLQFIGWEYEV